MYLAGGFTDVNMRAATNISAYLGGSFQAAFEEEVGNSSLQGYGVA